MFDVDAIIAWLQTLPPVGVYAALWFTTYIENLFPPSPSDVVLLFIATLVGLGTIGFIPALGIATFGSVSGFLTAFLIGRRYGRSLLKGERLPFLNRKALAKVQKWFARWGYGVIIANRFLAGTRAVISFFAGISHLKLVPTTLLCTISALAWNGAVIWLGAYVGENWEEGREILADYGLVVLILIAAVIAFVVGKRIFR